MAGNVCEDTLIHDLAEDHAEKIFYYCLKKTGNAHEAEDLTSDILLNIIAGLEKGTVPENFPAWIWRIARNRYSIWAEKKHKHSEEISGTDIGDFEIEDKTSGPEEALIHEEQLQLLRRELAFITSDFRNIVVAYYMQGRRISDIALSLGLPEGTVTSKLHRARNKLKEGMNMAREFGKRSYDPEQIAFCASGNQPTGLPWSAIQRKIPVNILCEAHSNPCSLQELAMELGIAAPYMEEEVELLVRAELLKKLDHGKYVTNFFIEPKECQNEINEIVCAYTQQHASVIWQLAAKALEKAGELGVTTGEYSNDDAQMYFAFYIASQIEISAFSGNLYSKFKRDDGGNWGIIGFEQGCICRLPSVSFSNNRNVWNGTQWNGYQALPGNAVFGNRRYGMDVPYAYLNITLKGIAEGLNPADFSDAEKENLQQLIGQNFCVMRNDGTAFVNALVFQKGMKEKLDAYLMSLSEYKILQENMQSLVASAKEIIARYANAYLQDDFEYYVAMSVVELRFTLSRLWKDTGLYTGESAQFCAFYL